MYVCIKTLRARFASVRFKVLLGSVRFKVQGMTDTRWITYNLTSPAAGCCLICFCLNCCPPHPLPFFCLVVRTERQNLPRWRDLVGGGVI